MKITQPLLRLKTEKVKNVVSESHVLIGKYRTMLSAFYGYKAHLSVQKITAIIALDISVAFDTTNHSILLRRLHCNFGIAGAAFD